MTLIVEHIWDVFKLRALNFLLESGDVASQVTFLILGSTNVCMAEDKSLVTLVVHGDILKVDKLV